MTTMTRSIARNIHRSASRRRGFTLTEVLLVLAILGVIAAMVVPNLLGQQKAALIKTTKMSIKSLEDACTHYAIAHDGEYPQGGSNEVINMLVNPTDKDNKPISPYLPKVPKDAWGQPLYYEYPPTGKAPNLTVPAIWSSGPDKKSDDGANDDINNWTN